jgi:ketosteroid isomerase-like protein
MTEDVVFLLPGKPPLRGREEFASRFRAMSCDVVGTRVDGIPEIHKIRVSGDLAYVWPQLSVRITGADGEGRIASLEPPCRYSGKARTAGGGFREMRTCWCEPCARSCIWP